MSTPKFSFVDFEASPDLQEMAALAMEQIIDHAPYGAHPAAMIKRIVSDYGVQYHCAVELHTRYGPFTARAQRSDAISALISVEHAMLAKLRRWARNRPVAFQVDEYDSSRSA